MELSPGLGLLAVALLLATNGFFVASEFAIVAARRSRLEQLAAAGSANARAALRVVRHLDTYIAACQVGITMASLVLGWIGEPALAHVIEPPVEALVGTFAPAAAHIVSLVVSLLLITSLHIIVGEQAPKGVALQRPEATTLFTAAPLQFFELIFRVPTAALQHLTGLLLRLIGLEPVTGHESVHSVEELRLLVRSSTEAGVVEESEARIASRAFTFADRTAGALMTPRTELEAVSVDVPPHELERRLATTRHTRVPVYEGSLDNILGVLPVLTYFRALRSLIGTPDDLRQLIRPAMAVPESKPADDLLEQMRTTGRYFAIVIDEFGGTAGVVTMDDLVAALVGPLHPDEADTTPREPDDLPPTLQPDGAFLVSGLTKLDEWSEITHTSLTEADIDDADQVETVGGLIMARLGRIPVVGDEVAIGGWLVRVEQMDAMRVARARLIPPPPAPSSAE
jgi:putative hemolysin